ncbi:hypothetical protein ACI2OX_12630 [Bacillus sp. N9]
MKKKFVLFVAMMLLAFTTACSNKAETNEGDKEVAPKKTLN